MKNLSECAVLVNIKISQWSGRKYDDDVTRQIEAEHNARKAGNFNKSLIDQEGLKEIKSISSETRQFFRKNTLNWSDNGDRILPATNYFEFVEKWREFDAQFNQSSKKFLSRYLDFKDEAKRRLNGMYREADYPTVEKLRSKFDISISFMPISNTSDFRLKVNEEEVKNLKKQIESEINNRINLALKDICERIREAVSHMIEKLTEKDAIFRNSLVTNIEELINLLPRLNFTENQDIADIINHMKSLLADPDNLRSSARLRNEKVMNAKAILAKVHDFLG